MSLSYNNSFYAALNLNISHELGMVDLANSNDRDVYTKAHQLMFETVRIHNISEYQITSVVVMYGSKYTSISKNPSTKQWHVTMRDPSDADCLIQYNANTSATGEYFAQVDYDTAAGTYCNSNFTNPYMTNLGVLQRKGAVGRLVNDSGKGFMLPPYYNPYGEHTIGLVIYDGNLQADVGVDTGAAALFSSAHVLSLSIEDSCCARRQTSHSGRDTSCQLVH